jgi:outer membrane lipase/esterase
VIKKSRQAVEPTMKKALFALALVCSPFLIPSKVLAQEFGQLFIFGDSLVDNGNLFRLTQPTGNAIPPSPPYFQGRFSNGLVWSELIGGEINIVPTSTTNFALGGSTSGSTNSISPQLPSLTAQIAQFLALPGTPNPNALYVLLVGANDYLRLPVQTRSTESLSVVNNISNTVNALIDKGARNILVSNLPNLGNTPQEQAFGTFTASSSTTENHNRNLNTALGLIARSRSDVNIIPLDLNALVAEVTREPSRYGLTNVTTSCFNQQAGTICSNPNEFLYWDGLHPTAAGHQLIAKYAASVVNAPAAIIPQGELALNVAQRQVQVIDARLQALNNNAIDKVNNTQEQTKQYTEEKSASRWGTFVNGGVGFGDRDSNSNTQGYNFTTADVAAGVDYRVSNELALGVAFGYVNNDTDLKNGRGTVDIKGYAVSLYSNYAKDNFYLSTVLGYGGNDFLFRRQTNFDNRTATANTEGNQFSVNLNGGYVAKSNNVSYGPTVGLRYNQVNINGYTESGADSLNMKINDQQINSLVLSVGAQAAIAINTGKDSKIVPNIRASYEHEFANDSRTITTELVSQPGIPMRAGTNNPDRDYIKLGAGAQMLFSKNFSAALDYETILGRNDFSDNLIKGELRYQF